MPIRQWLMLDARVHLTTYPVTLTVMTMSIYNTAWLKYYRQQFVPTKNCM